MKLVALLAPIASLMAARLEPASSEAFDRYVREAQARMDGELAGDGPFLFWIDADQRLRGGEILVESYQPPRLSGALIHHRVAALFVTGATLAKALAVVEDYEHYERTYTPDIARSKLLERNGHDARVYLRITKKKGITVTVNSEHEIRYRDLDPQRGVSRSRSTRIAEIENPGAREEREKPVGNDRGFLWRLDSWWRFREKDGGLYVQIESISLSRDAPAGLGWLVSGFIHSAHREFLLHMIASTRAALVAMKP